MRCSDSCFMPQIQLYFRDPCAENPCKNGGKCSRDMSDPTDFTKRVCNCTSGFSGVDCEGRNGEHL